MKERFIPSDKNDYRPHVLQKSAVIAMGVLILLTFTIVNIQSLVWVSSDWLVSTILPAVIVEETNKAREGSSLSELRRNSVLDAAATDKAEHMAEEGYFDHYSPEGISPWYWIKSEGYQFVHAGENLAVHFTDSTTVVEAWLDSPSHRDNILNSNYEEIGIGVARGEYQGFDTIFVVQMFGTPISTESAGIEVTEEDVSTSEEDLVADISIPQAQVAGEQVYDEDHVVLTSDHISTSTNSATVARDTEMNLSTQESTPMWLGVITQPKTVLQLIYFVIGLFVIVSLVLSIIIEIKHQRPTQIGYGLGLLLLMFVLLQVHLSLVGNITIV